MMKCPFARLWPVLLALAAIAFASVSCAAGPRPVETAPVSGGQDSLPEMGPRTTPPVYTPPVYAPPERPVKPPIPEFIMGKGIITAKDLAAFLLETNPWAEPKFVENLALYYTEEAAIEGVNHDAVFAQMCLETGFLRYGGLVTPDMNNFCGLGATGLPGPDGLPVRGLSFPNPRTGARAHVQHLKAYATAEPLKQELADPRYRYVRLGSSPTIKGLSGTWAADRSYADKINTILERLYGFAFKT